MCNKSGHTKYDLHKFALPKAVAMAMLLAAGYTVASVVCFRRLPTLKISTLLSDMVVLTLARIVWSSLILLDKSCK